MPLELVAIIVKSYPGSVKYETTIRCEIPITVRRRPDECASLRAFDQLPSPAKRFLHKASYEHLRAPWTNVEVRMVPEIPLDVNFGSTHVNRRGELASDSEDGSPMKSPEAIDVPLPPLKSPLFNRSPPTSASRSTPHSERFVISPIGHDGHGGRRSESIDSWLGSEVRLPIRSRGSRSLFAATSPYGRAKHSRQHHGREEPTAGSADNRVTSPQKKQAAAYVDHVLAKKSSTLAGADEKRLTQSREESIDDSSNGEQDDSEKTEPHHAALRDDSGTPSKSR